jgi:hypothetical protein
MCLGDGDGDGDVMVMVMVTVMMMVVMMMAMAMVMVMVMVIACVVGLRRMHTVVWSDAHGRIASDCTGSEHTHGYSVVGLRHATRILHVQCSDGPE